MGPFSNVLGPGQAVPVLRTLALRPLVRRVRLPWIRRRLLRARTVASRELRLRIQELLGLLPGACHPDDARFIARAGEDVLCPGRYMYEVPRLQRPLLAVDEQRALPGQHEEVLLHCLRVVEAVRLARLEDADV